MEIIISIIVFIYGLVFGSFFNVVGYRLPKGMSIISPRGSFCPECNHELKWYELIPLFSFIIQRGKCTKCKKKISLYYPLIELLTGILFLISYLTFGITSEFAISLIICSYFVIVVVSDGRYMIIPDEVTLVMSMCLILVEVLVYGPERAFISIVSGFVLFILVYLFMKACNLIFKKDTLGGGDIKLEFFTGCLLGVPNGLFSIFIGSILALPLSIVNAKKDNMVPFGPFLLLGALIIYIFKIDVIKILNDLSYLF